VRSIQTLRMIMWSTLCTRSTQCDCSHNDVIGSRDVISYVISCVKRRSNSDKKKSAISNSFRDIWPEILWIHDVITDVTLPGSTIRVHHFTHYAVDDYVKRWSNSVRNCRRYSMLKVVMSRLWRHRVMWRHRWRHYSIALGHFPIGSQ